MASSSSNNPPSLSQLELLPAEVKNQILEKLPRIDRLCIKCTCRTFWPVVDPPTRNGAFQLEKHRHFNWRTPSLPPGPLACGRCGYLKPYRKFTNKNTKRDRARGGSLAKTRVCIDCGLTKDSTGYALYSRGTFLTIGKETMQVCMQCEKLDRHVKGHDDLCAECWEQSQKQEVFTVALMDGAASGDDEYLQKHNSKKRTRSMCAEEANKFNKRLKAEAKHYVAGLKRKRNADKRKAKQGKKGI